jgi:hypothetical protein
MTPSEANKININNETNLDKLRELVKFWQNLTISAITELQKHKPTFTLDDLRNSDEENSVTK